MKSVLVILVAILLLASCAKDNISTSSNISSYLVFDEQIIGKPSVANNQFLAITKTYDASLYITKIDINGVRTHLLALKNYITDTIPPNFPNYPIVAVNNGYFALYYYTKTSTSDTSNQVRIIKLDLNGNYVANYSDSIDEINNTKSTTFLNFFATQGNGFVIVSADSLQKNNPDRPKFHPQLSFYDNGGKFISNIKSNDSIFQFRDSHWLTGDRLLLIGTGSPNASGGGIDCEIFYPNNKSINNLTIKTQIRNLNSFFQDDTLIIVEGDGGIGNQPIIGCYSLLNGAKQWENVSAPPGFIGYAINKNGDNYIITGGNKPIFEWITISSKNVMVGVLSKIISEYDTYGLGLIVNSPTEYIFVGYKNSFSIYNNLFYLKTK